MIKTTGKAILLLGKGAVKGTIGTAKLAYKYPKTALIASAGGIYATSSRSDRIDKKRVQMMLENYKGQ